MFLYAIKEFQDKLQSKDIKGTEERKQKVWEIIFKGNKSVQLMFGSSESLLTEKMK